MYRIVCESYENYIKDFLPHHRDDYRYKIVEHLELIVDLEKYSEEKEKNTLKYRKLESLIYLLKKHIEDYPNFKSFLWALDSRKIEGVDCGALSHEEFRELTKIINMFLRLSYWY